MGENRESGGKVKPMRNGNITKLYTEGLDKEPERAFKGKPKDEKTNPIKHNLATRVDKAAIMEAYNDVMADNNNIEWAAFTFSDNKLGVAAKGVDFAEFKSHFGADDRGFGYIKITTGDEMSAVQVCVLHLGGAQRVRYEEGQDVDRQGPPQGHHHQPVRRAVGGECRRVHPGAFQNRGRQGRRCQVRHWGKRDVTLCFRASGVLPPNIGLEDLLAYTRSFLCIPPNLMRSFLRSPRHIRVKSISKTEFGPILNSFFQRYFNIPTLYLL